MKRGYFVSDPDADYGFPVVAHTAKEAKAIVWKEWRWQFDCKWVEITSIWRRQASVDDLPIGLVDDDVIALRHKLIDYLSH